MTQQQQQQQHPLTGSTIRHAGRASVRGKIRRVWRSRYLELLDVGHVKYYEQEDPAAAASSSAWEEDLSLMSSNASTTNNTSLMLRHRQYKYRLQILHARILDGTTLRDLHVGLPRGAYGWVFRARRLVLQPEGSWTVDPLKEERDFYCAVGQLEQAQMWVVALQWAAAVTSNHRIAAAGLEDDWEHADDDDVEIMLHNDGATASDEVASLVSQPSSVGDGSSAVHVDVPSTPTHANTTPRNVRPRKITGTTVVTKVTGWQIVRTQTTTWTLAYSIQVLQCRHGNNDNNSVQSWLVWRTPADVQRLVRSLQNDAVVPLFPVTVPHLQKSTDYMHVWTWLDWFLRKLVTDASYLNTTAVKKFLGLSASASSRPIVSLDASPAATTVASAAVALYLNTIQRVVQPLVQIHSLDQVYPVATPEPSKSSSSLEGLVKEWLANRPAPHAPPGWTQALLWCQARVRTAPPTLWWAAGGTTLAIFWWWGRAERSEDVFLPYASVSSAASNSMWTLGHMPRVAVRLDILVVSWVGAAYLGRLVWPRPSATTTTSTTTARSKRARRRRDQVVVVHDDDDEHDDEPSSLDNTTAADDLDDDSFGDANEQEEIMDDGEPRGALLSSPLPQHPANDGQSCWSQPASNIFYVRSQTYLQDRVKEPSGPAPLTCRGVDVWMTDNPERHIARHPAVLGGKLLDEDTFLVNFLLPFGNFVAYFGIPPLSEFPAKLRNVWTKFLAGDQQYRDARLKLLPVVVEGPWIVKAAVGPGKSPALLGKAIPLQYFFDPGNAQRKAVYEVDVIITASTIAKGILSVVKGHTKSVSIAFAFIIEAAEEADLPETVLCTFQVHSLHLEDCPLLPPMPESDSNNLSL